MYTSVTWTYGAHARTELASKLSTLAAVTLAVLPTCTALENHTAEQGGWTWYHIGFGAVVTAATAVFVAIGASHLAATWILRKDFDVASRSPLLGVLSGAVAGVVSFATVFRMALSSAQLPATRRGSVAAAVIQPLIFTCFTCAYGMRGLRLVILYDADIRERWGMFVKDRVVAKSLMISFVAIEVLVWSAGLAVGVDRVASWSVVFAYVDSLASMAIYAIFLGTFRKTLDIFGLSVEIKKVGVFFLVASALWILAQFFPQWLRRVVMVLSITTRFLTALWLSNVRPIRAILRERAGNNGNCISSLFPYVPWGARKKVAIEAGEGSIETTRLGDANTPNPDTSLDRILNFPPLFKAFEEFCRQALCSESLQFIVAAAEFKESLATSAIANGKMDFDNFVSTVDKYIKDSSPFEVNIDSKSKRDIMSVANAAAFRELSQDEKAHILDAATKEVGRMLEDNLLHKFHKTPQFKQINEMLFSPPEPDSGDTHDRAT